MSTSGMGPSTGEKGKKNERIPRKKRNEASNNGVKVVDLLSTAADKRGKKNRPWGDHGPTLEKKLLEGQLSQKPREERRA